METEKQKAVLVVDKILENIYQHTRAHGEILSELLIVYIEYDNKQEKLLQDKNAEYNEVIFLNECRQQLKDRILYFTMVCNGYELDTKKGWVYRG